MGDQGSTFDELMQAAYKALSRRSLTVKELSQKLRRHKRADSAVIEKVLQECVKDGYIDERSIAEYYIQKCRLEKLYGRFRIRHELAQRGISVEVIEEELEQGFPESEEEFVARQFAEKKMRGMTGVDRQKQYHRIGSALKQRGFGGYVIGSVLRQLNHGPDEEV